MGEYEEFGEGLTGRLMLISPDQKIEDLDLVLPEEYSGQVKARPPLDTWT